MSSFNSTTLKQLSEFNQQSLRYRIPALAFLGFMLPLGILGNASVIYIYGLRLKYSNVNLFITLLAVSDIFSCLVGIPMEMYRLYAFYNYSSIAACKVEGFVTFACYICSMLMLLTISMERYVKVCRSTGTQMSRKTAKILAGTVFFVSSLLGVPMLVFAAPHVYTLDNGTVVQNCTYHIEYELWFYAVALFVAVLTVLAAMFVFYWRVLKITRSHVIWTQQRKAEYNVKTIEDVTQPPKPEAGTKKLSQTNRTVIWISTVYAASCVPIFTIAVVTKFFTHLKVPNSVDYLLFLLFQSWIFNCTLNPIVYGFLNSKFRAELGILFNLILVRANSSSVEKADDSNQMCSSTTC